MHRISYHQPHPIHSAAASRAIEHAQAGALPPHTLMQRAGLAVARLAQALAPHARQTWIACGPGNNGGDGLEAAMHLHRAGRPVHVTWLGTPEQAPSDAHLSWQRAVQAGVTFTTSPPGDLGPADLVIDALLGLGVQASAPARALDARWAATLHHLRSHPGTLLAVDLPTGLDADTGQWAPALAPPAAQALQRIHTLSLLTLKPGLFTAQGRDACGTLWFDDLGVAQQPASPAPTAWLNAAPPPAARLHDSHKGTYGDVAVVGGEHDAAHGSAMAGAALLAASAALHGGAGRVYVSLLGDPALALDVTQPELMFRRFDALDLPTLTVVCGCGGGNAVRDVLPAVLAQAPRLVLDADALNAIAHSNALQTALTQRAAHGQASVLTPHPLEAARLLGQTTQQIQHDRPAAAQALAQRFQCAVVLKGSGSIIAAPGQLPRLNPTGNARLATPGTGDVLAGLTGARLAAGLPPFDAACHATHHHGATADAWPLHQPLTASALARQLAP